MLSQDNAKNSNIVLTSELNKYKKSTYYQL